METFNCIYKKFNWKLLLVDENFEKHEIRDMIIMTILYVNIYLIILMWIGLDMKTNMEPNSHGNETSCSLLAKLHTLDSLASKDYSIHRYWNA